MSPLWAAGWHSHAAALKGWFALVISAFFFPFSCMGMGMMPQQLSTPAAHPVLLMGERAWVIPQGTSPSRENPGSTPSSAKLHIVACQSNAHLCPALPPHFI